jgi:putative DNA methylase
LDTFDKLFTNRQLTALTTFSGLVAEAQSQVIRDGGSLEYAQAVGVYLAFVIDKMADLGNSLSRWEPNAECPRQLFARQAIPMVWDYAESNIFSSSSGSWDVFLNNLMRSFSSALFEFPREKYGFVQQHDAQTDIGLRDIMVSTDPPYYDNISYADLSDFFYVWLRQTLKDVYPDLFRTMLVPKAEELVATPYRFDGDRTKARKFFEDGMLQAFKQICTYSRESVPVTVYYAYKQSEDDSDSATASTGWETMLSAIVQSGFTVTGTWPMRTEMGSRMVGQNTNALASSIVLVCRKRGIENGEKEIENSQEKLLPISSKLLPKTCTRRDFINALKRELKPALQKLQASNIAPVDLAQSAIGPGMGVYSRFSKVLEADGTPMSVRSALQIINQELDLYFTEQDGELDRDSRFCVDLYTQYAFNDMKFGEADVLARAKNTSVENLRAAGVLYAEKGVVRLVTREEIPQKLESSERIIWLLTQLLTHALETDGVNGAAKIVAGIFTSEPEHAKALAYRLFQIAERKGWAGEAYVYNSLVIVWPDVLSRAAEITAAVSSGEQQSLVAMEDK